MEDLWAFNEEVVARAIYNSRIPVISAVGHEPDVTIADFVADVRASTPSNAAELAVPDQNELFSVLGDMGVRMEQSVKRMLYLRRRELERLGRSRSMTQPESYFRDKRMQLDYQSQRMVHAMQHTLDKEKRSAARLAAALDALSPLKVLGRGYSIATDKQGRVISSVAMVQSGDTLNLRMEDGSLSCRVEERKCR